MFIFDLIACKDNEISLPSHRDQFNIESPPKKTLILILKRSSGQFYTVGANFLDSFLNKSYIKVSSSQKTK